MEENGSGFLLAAQVALIGFVGVRSTMAWLARGEQGVWSKTYLRYFLRVIVEVAIALLLFVALLWWMGEAGQ
jgi:hypothetical protein